jgi:hypothetical protein
MRSSFPLEHRGLARLIGVAMADERRTQRIGRREIDLWREHQIARCEAQRTRLEALEQALQKDATAHSAEAVKWDIVDDVAGKFSAARERTLAQVHRYWADKLTAILNDQP